MRRRRLTGSLASWLAAAGVAPFAVAVTLAVAGAALSMAGERHPYFADPSGVETDAHAVARGGPVYQDPAEGYTPLNYTPLLPVIAAGLDHLVFWSGWTALISLLAGVALAGMAAWLAWRSAPPGTARVPIAVGAGALAWWLIACVPFNFLAAPRPDQLSWALAVGGLLALPRAAQGSRRHALILVVLLTAAVWTKQTAVAAVVAAVAALAWLVLRGRVPWSRAGWLVAILAVLNAAIFGLLALGTGGWATVFLIEVPSGGARINSIGLTVERAVTALLLPAVLAALVWATTRRSAPGAEHRLVLGIFTVTALAFGIVFHAKQGTAHNQFLGAAWGLALLAAAGYGAAARATVPAAIAAVAALALFGAASSERLRDSAAARLSLNVSEPSPEAFVAPVPAALREVSVFHPVHSGLALEHGGAAYPNHNNIQDLLAGGERPLYLVRTLLARPFEVAYLFERTPEREAYASGYGAREENFIWKLNELIRSGYEPWRDAPAGLLAARQVPGLTSYTAVGPLRRRAVPRDTWMRDCFAPFRSAGGEWEIGRGGGFWCRERPSRYRLRRAPASVSELRTVAGEALAGTLAVELSGEAAATLEGPGWTLRVDPRSAELRAAGGTRSIRLPPASRRRLEIRGGGPPALASGDGGVARARVGELAGSDRLRVLADAGSDAVVDVGGLRRR